MSRSYTSAKRAHRGQKPTFTLDDVEFVCEGGISTLDISEFAIAAKNGMDTDNPLAAAVFAEFFQAALGPTQYRRFKDHIRRHETDGDVLVDIMQGLMEDFVGRPTTEPSHSQDGPSTTGRMSRVVSLQQGSVQIVGDDPPDRSTPMRASSG